MTTANCDQIDKLLVCLTTKLQSITQAEHLSDNLQPLAASITPSVFQYIVLSAVGSKAGEPDCPCILIHSCWQHKDLMNRKAE